MKNRYDAFVLVNHLKTLGTTIVILVVADARGTTWDTCPYTTQHSCSTNGYQRLGILIHNKCTNIRNTSIINFFRVFKRDV